MMQGAVQQPDALVVCMCNTTNQTNKTCIGGQFLYYQVSIVIASIKASGQPFSVTML